jgi:hypothetical protein
MVYSIHLYVVDSKNTSAFVASMRDGRLWRNSSRQLPNGLIGVDLLSNLSLPNGFVSLEIWSSLEAYRRATESPENIVLINQIRQLATSCFDLGPFTFLPRADDRPTCAEAFLDLMDRGAVN